MPPHETAWATSGTKPRGWSIRPGNGAILASKRKRFTGSSVGVKGWISLKETVPETSTLPVANDENMTNTESANTTKISIATPSKLSKYL